MSGPRRIRLRTWMIAVAVLALPMGGAAILRTRQLRFRALAEFHRGRIQSRFATPNQPGWIRLLSIDKDGNSVSAEQVERDTREALISRRYEEAARRPWLPLRLDGL